MQERHIWTAHFADDGREVPGSLPYYTASAAYRVARRATRATGRTTAIRRDGVLYRTWTPSEVKRHAAA